MTLPTRTHILLAPLEVRSGQTDRQTRKRVLLLTGLAGLLWSALILAVPPAANAGQILGAPTYIGLSSGLVGYWSFNADDIAVNNSGDVVAYDRSGTNNHSSPAETNVPAKRVRGRIGQAMDFDGNTADIGVPTSATLNNMAQVSASLWLYTRDTLDFRPILTKMFSDTAQDGWEINDCGCGTNNILFDVGYEGASDLWVETTTAPIKLNQWQHIAVTWDGVADGTGITIYIDGTSVPFTINTTGAGGKTDDSANELHIGNNGNGNAAWDGSIDEVRLYNRVLSADEVKRLYKIGATLKYGAPNSTGSLSNGLVGWWTMDGNDTPKNNGGLLTALDRSGNNYHARSGAVAQNPQNSVGKLGQSVNFDGAGDQLFATAASLGQLNAITVSAWIYPKGFGGLNLGSILERVSGAIEWGFGLDNTDVANGLTFFMNCTGPLQVFAANSITLNKWQHVLVTWTGGCTNASVTFYVDGVVKARSGASGSGSPPNDNGLGFELSSDSSDTFYFNGRVDDLRLYNRAISADEIKRIYKMGSTLKQGVASNSGGINNGLVGWWTMDGKDVSIDGSSVITAFDRSGNSRHASSSPQTPPTRAIGKIGQGLEFDSSTNLLSAGKPTVFNNMTEKTICAWIKPTSFATRDIMGKWDTSEFGGWTLRLADSCATGQDLCYYHNFFPSNGRWSTSGGITLNAWNHACMSYTTSELNDPVFYINGTSRAVTEVVEPGGTSRDESTASLVLGNISENAADSSFGGTLDEVRIYNRALSADEVKRLYNMGR